MVSIVEVVLVILLIAAMIVLATQIAPIFADELSRDDIRNLKAEIDDAEKYQVTIENEIVEQRLKIRGNGAELEKLKQEFKEIKRTLSSSWESVQNVDEAEQNVRDFEQEMNDDQKQLIALLTDKNNWFETEQVLKKQLEEDNEIWRQQTQVDLTGMTKLIGIKLSQNCVTMIKNNITNNCPDYELLEQLDTSNTFVSGEFEFSDGYYHRGTSQYKDGFRWYDYDSMLRILVDPPSEHQSRIKMITIENNFNIFLERPIDNKVHNNTITQHKDRWIERCRDAQISTNNWKVSLPDTIYYLRNGCTITGFDNTIIDEREYTYWNPEDSAEWHYRNWIENAKILCLGLC